MSANTNTSQCLMCYLASLESFFHFRIEKQKHVGNSFLCDMSLDHSFHLGPMGIFICEAKIFC